MIDIQFEQASGVKSFQKSKWVQPEKKIDKVLSPYHSEEIGHFEKTQPAHLQEICSHLLSGQKDWAKKTLRERTQVFYQFRNLLISNSQKLSVIIARESGKTPQEALAGLQRGIEVVEFALGLCQFDLGGKMEVSKAVFCEYRREPLGVVSIVTPFNFPAMIALWMLPIALILGNSVLWKPSEKTPMTSEKIIELLLEAGLPSNCIASIFGDKEIVQAMSKISEIQAIGFVGSTPVAKSIYSEFSSQGKRVAALGGAKNTIFLTPDADPDLTVAAIVDSFTGCAGQRCMAGSLLLTVGNCDSFLDAILNEAKKNKKAALAMGALIDTHSKERILKSLDEAEKEGAKILLDGRNPSQIPSSWSKGNWLDPILIESSSKNQNFLNKELFGPVLTLVQCSDLEEALEIESKIPYGNAASIFTQKAATAEQIIQKAQAGMIGVNVGVPVPREPFSFGGIHDSKFGALDITGMSGVEFWSQKKKITSKWVQMGQRSWNT